MKKIQNIVSIEIGLVMTLPWVAYLIAQFAGLSGIVTILFNGLANAIYIKPNITSFSDQVIFFL
jgi:NhaP-type Na+/H+ or K+/H+ antiporter